MFDAPCSATWQLRLLGGFELRGRQQRYTRLFSRAGMCLLARLAMAPQRQHPREELGALLWPQASEEEQRRRLRQTLSTLKALLEREGSPSQPVIVANRLTIQLAEGALVCDVARFERWAAAGPFPLAEACSEPYGGELLPGFYDEWIVDERHRLLALAERAALHAARPGIAATASHPPENPRSALPATLPRYLNPWVGSEAGIDAVVQAVAGQRLLTIYGAGGCGKTRLATEALIRIAQEGPFDALHFVCFAQVNSAAGAEDRLALDIGLPGGRAGVPTLAQALAGRRCLLVLDNCEALREHIAGWVSSLTAQLPGLHVLATSRLPLGLSDEHLVPIPALPVPADDGLSSVRESAAVALFVQRARESRADFIVHAGNAAALAALVRRLDGWPLALQLAAARVRQGGPEGLLRELQATGPAPALAVDGPQACLQASSQAGARTSSEANARGLAEVLAWSWQHLSPGQRSLLMYAALGPPRINAAWTAGAAPLALCQHEADAAWMLESLERAGLLRSQGELDGQIWYALSPPVAAFVARLPGARALQTQAEQRWRESLRRWAEALNADTMLHALDAALPAWLWALHGANDAAAHDEVLGLVLALAPAWAERSLPSSALSVFLATVATLETADARPVAAALRARAQALAMQQALASGQRERAAKIATRIDATSAAQQEHGPALQLSLARVTWRAQGRAAEAQAMAEAVLAAAASAGDAPTEAAAASLLATMANEVKGDHAAARRLYEHALQRLAASPGGNAHQLRGLRYNLAITEIYAGEVQAALPALEGIEAEARRAGDRHLLSQVLSARGSALDMLGQRREALRATQQALQEAWASMEAVNVLYALWNLSPLYLALGDAERALRLMAFAQNHWQAHFGTLSAQDARDAARLRRHCRRLLGVQPGRRLRAEGEALSLAQAVALGLPAHGAP
jgi:RecA/RadA recombinase